MRRILRFRTVDRQGFEDIRTGLKAIETRAATTKYQSLAPGDTVVFVCGKERFERTITKVYRWKSIDAMVRSISWKRVMPRAASLAEVKRAYQSYPGYEEKIRAHGLIGFESA